MTSRFRILWRRLLQVKVSYRQVNVVKFPKIPQSSAALPYTLGFSLLTLIGLEQKLSPEDELIMTIKHCVLFIQRSEYDKAERLLHVALRQAQQMNHQQGITYIYDVMANLALEREQYDKAKKLFISVSQRLMADGVPETDPKFIHLSAKLARISHMQKEYTTAQLGYDWCLEKLNTVLGKDPSEGNMKLLAMTEDWYGRLFLECNRVELGLSYLEKAYNRMKELSDMEPEHLVIQLNDIGTACERLGAVDESIKYFLQAIDLGKKLPEMHDIAAIYINLGRAYMRKHLLDEARKSCGYAWKLAVTNKSNDIKHEAELCINEIKGLS